jgi:hypothetical protein
LVRIDLMGRLGVWETLVLAVGAVLVLSKATDPALLLDSDTAVLLDVVRERGRPLSWFTGDWPLGNHFYRPVSTMLFEMDSALYGDQAWGYGLTNALLAAASVGALFWFVREWTGLPWCAGLSALLFGAWHFVQPGLSAFGAMAAVGTLVPLIGIARWGLAAAPRVALAIVCAGFVSTQVDPVVNLGWRTLGWLPGRTASSMTLFVLISLAAYARYLRLGPRKASPPSATDVPLTKSAPLAVRRPGRRWPWLLASLTSLALALGCHEQAAMAPFLLVCLQVVSFRRHGPVSIAPLLAFGAVLAGYAALRTAFVPIEASEYQLQQFRQGTGALLALSDYLLPAGAWLFRLTVVGSVGWWAVLVPEAWRLVAVIVGNVAMVWVAAKSLRSDWLIGAWVMSVLAFLPMAWLKTFEHYHYLPGALRAMLAVLLAAEALRLVANAVAPPVLQAPPRPSPAPGSLPRP